MGLPLRAKKGSTFEGGMRVPCIVRWLGHVPAGKTCDEIMSTMDLLPSFAGLAGGTCQPVLDSYLRDSSYLARA